MVIVGIDAHKRTHTAVVIDEAGRRLGEKTTRATTTEANLELVRWVHAFGPDRRFAVEDCRHLSRRLEADLLAAGEVLVRVPPKMMAHARDAARTYGKSDPRWHGQRSASRTCRLPGSTAPLGSCGCSWTTGRTWSGIGRRR